MKTRGWIVDRSLGGAYRILESPDASRCIAQVPLSTPPGKPLNPEDLQRAKLIAVAPLMLEWLERHYAAEEGSGETDRPEYVDLRALLKAIR